MNAMDVPADHDQVESASACQEHEQLPHFLRRAPARIMRAGERAWPQSACVAKQKPSQGSETFFGIDHSVRPGMSAAHVGARRQNRILRFSLTHEITMPRVPVPGRRQEYVRVIKTEEKGSDVNLATHLLHDAHMGRFEVAVVVSRRSHFALSVKPFSSLIIFCVSE